MKICFVLTSLLAPAAAFTTRPALVMASRTCRPTVTLKETAAEEYLDQCTRDWDDLEKQLINLKAEAKLHSDDDPAKQLMATADLAEKMLTKALDTARATRDVEMEQASKAHEVFDEAMKEELEAEAILHQFENDEMGSAQQAGMVEGLDATYEDTERLRDLSVVHAAHDERMDWMNKVMNAEQVAAKAKLEFTSAERKLEQLKQNEAELKEALKELHNAKNTLMMKQLEKQKEQ